MKTFEEALNIFYREVPITPESDYEALMREHSGEMDAGMIYRNDSMNEVVFSGKAQRFIESMQGMAAEQPGYSVLTFALHAFAHGVAVGIEMERQELSQFEE